MGEKREEEIGRDGIAALQVSCIFIVCVCVCSCKGGVALDFLVKGKHACHVGFILLRDSLAKKENPGPGAIRERKVF